MVLLSDAIALGMDIWLHLTVTLDVIFNPRVDKGWHPNDDEKCTGFAYYTHYYYFFDEYLEIILHPRSKFPWLAIHLIYGTWWNTTGQKDSTRAESHLEDSRGKDMVCEMCTGTHPSRILSIRLEGSDDDQEEYILETGRLSLTSEEKRMVQVDGTEIDLPITEYCFFIFPVLSFLNFNAILKINSPFDCKSSTAALYSSEAIRALLEKCCPCGSRYYLYFNTTILGEYIQNQRPLVGSAAMQHVLKTKYQQRIQTLLK